MSVLIKDMEKPKYCYTVIDGESEYCPFVNTDDDCVLLLKKGRCEGTWEEQYSKCPLIEATEPCEDAVSRKAVEEMLKNGFPARGMWEIEGDVEKQTVCETLADALIDLERLPSVTPKAEPKWTPCSEKVDIPDHEILACDKYGEEMFGYLVYEDDQWICVSDGCEMVDPIAWREKPEPYREEG